MASREWAAMSERVAKLESELVMQREVFLRVLVKVAQHLVKPLSNADVELVIRELEWLARDEVTMDVELGGGG